MTNPNIAAFAAQENASDPHEEWLEQWRVASHAADIADDQTPEERRLLDQAENLSQLICCTPVNSLDALDAQIQWCKEDLGVYLEDAGTVHHVVLDTILQGLRNIQHIHAAQ